jgi:hypothetical protein
VSALALAAVATPGFSCVPELDGTLLSVEFAGNADMSAIVPLSDYLKRVHEEATRLALFEVKCDFRKLLFMNSSCFKAFVAWIDVVKNATQPYRIRFLTDSNMPWQKRSLEPLRRLAIDVVSIGK